MASDCCLLTRGIHKIAYIWIKREENMELYAWLKSLSNNEALLNYPPANERTDNQEPKMNEDLETDAKPESNSYKEQAAGRTTVTDEGVIEHHHADGARTTLSVKAGQSRQNLQVGSNNLMVVGMRGGEDVWEDSQSRKAKSKRNKNVEAPSRAITDNDYDIVADNLGKDFRRLFREIGLRDTQIDQVYMDYKDEGIYEVNYQLLRKWKALGQASLSRLFQALQNIERYDIIELIPK